MAGLSATPAQFARSAADKQGDQGTISTLALGRALLGLIPVAPGMLKAAQVCVFGVPVPLCDGRAGMAAVVLATPTRFNGQRFAQQLRRELPEYALPLFVRVMAAQSTTDTFKIQIGVLQQEGFDLSASHDRLYVLAQASADYVALSAVLYCRILEGSLRLQCRSGTRNFAYSPSRILMFAVAQREAGEVSIIEYR